MYVQIVSCGTTGIHMRCRTRIACVTYTPRMHMQSYAIVHVSHFDMRVRRNWLVLLFLSRTWFTRQQKAQQNNGFRLTTCLVLVVGSEPLLGMRPVVAGAFVDG